MRRLCLVAVVAGFAIALGTGAALAQPRLEPAPPLPGSGAPSGPPTIPGPGSGSSAQPATSYWGAVAFTSDGSYSTAWKQPSKEVAEAHVAKECARFGRGRCEVIGFPGHLCVALTTYRSRRWRITFAGAGGSYPEAQREAMRRCEEDRRTNARRCQHRVAVCGDGR